MKSFADEIAENAQSVKQTGVADEQKIERETEDLNQLDQTARHDARAWRSGIGHRIGVARGPRDFNTGALNGLCFARTRQRNKNVDVPYADRGDEVGDNARAAKTFKGMLLRIEQIEAQQRETETENAYVARGICISSPMISSKLPAQPRKCGITSAPAQLEESRWHTD